MKGLKTGGRKKGTPNKITSGTVEYFTRNNIDLAPEAWKLYQSSEDPEFKLKVLSLLFPYVYRRKENMIDDESIDVTPEDMPLDEMKRLFISASEGLENLKLKISEKENERS